MLKRSLTRCPRRWLAPRLHPPLPTYSGSSKASSYFTKPQANFFTPPSQSYYSYANGDGQTSKPQLPSSARECNNQPNTILNQDNQSTIKLSENGKASSGKGTRHINIRYFFITDRIARKEVAIQYCPAKEMVADYFTKPLQGELFYKFRDQIMGVVPMDTITGDHRSVLNDEYNHPIPSDKLKKVYPKITNDAQPKRAQVSKGTNHPSWADVAKSKPPDGSNGRLLSILKKGSPILPL